MKRVFHRIKSPNHGSSTVSTASSSDSSSSSSPSTSNSIHTTSKSKDRSTPTSVRTLQRDNQNDGTLNNNNTTSINMNGSVNTSSPKGNKLHPRHPNDRFVETPTKSVPSSTTVGTASTAAAAVTLPTNVQVVARIRPINVKSSTNDSFFHTAGSTPSSRRRRLIGLKNSNKKKDTKSATAPGTNSTSTTTTNTVVAWDLIGDDTAHQSSKTDQIKGRTHSYTLDRVFGTSSSTQSIYDQSVRSLVVSAMQGYHSTVLAYGQTSTGKTHTMSGTKEDPGLIPLAVNECFRLVKDGTLDGQGAASSSLSREYLFRLSYLEVYKEHIRDLLNPTPEPVRLFDGPNGLLIRGLKEEVVTNPTQVFDLLRKGEKRRSVGATNMNQHSSRSHTLVRLWIESSTVVSTGRRRTSSSTNDKATTRVSSLSLVDLAGSESVRLNGTERREEGQYINKSLMTLGQVVLSLSETAAPTKGDGKKKEVAHIPYRDSKLTRLLQPSLSGNAQMVLLCCISPLVSHLDESHNTFKFATRAKRIEQRATINTVDDNEETLLQTYREEIEDLRKQLKEAKDQKRFLEARARQVESERLQLQSSSSQEEVSPPETATRTASATTMTTPGVSRFGPSLETATDEINELVEAIQSMEQLILKSRPEETKELQPLHEKGTNPTTDSSMIDNSLAKLLEQDEEDEDGFDELLIDDVYPSNRTPNGASSANKDGSTEDKLHAELTRIRGLLGSVLQKRGLVAPILSSLPRRSLEKEFSTPPGTPARDENSRPMNKTTEVESLRKQLEDQQRSTNLRAADSSFLQSQLKEKDQLLVEVSQLLEAVERRQTELESENAALKREIATLRQPNEF